MSWAKELASLYVPGDGTANVFGVVVYTDSHANIKKVLRDEDYWRAFDAESGPRWAVFAVRTHQGSYAVPKVAPGKRYMMIPEWREPAANIELLDDFGLDSTEDLPCLVVFTTAQASGTLSSIIQLDDATFEQAYVSIKSAVRIVASALQGVEEEWLKTADAYRAAERAIRAHHQWKKLKQGAMVLERLASLIP